MKVSTWKKSLPQLEQIDYNITSAKLDIRLTKLNSWYKVFKKGFDLGYRGPTQRKDTSQNLPLTIGSLDEIWNKIMKEVKLHRYAGPFDSIPYEYYMQSPIGLVPKDGGTKTRLIFHLSYNFKRMKLEEQQNSLNYFMPNELCTVKYNDLDAAIKACFKLKKEWDEGLWFDITNRQTDTGIIYYSKTAVVSAFRVLPMFPSHRCWLIMKTKHPRTGQILYFVDKCLPFGASISCALFQSFSDVLAYIAQYRSNIVLRGLYVPITNYLDDFLFMSFLKELCNRIMRIFMAICEDINCPISEEKTEWAQELITFLGMLLNERQMIISIPTDKLTKALSLLKLLVDKKKAKIVDIQRLAGMLNFLHRAIVPGRPFTRRMYDHIKLKNAKGQPLQNYHHVNLNKNFRSDCEVWIQFLNIAVVDKTLLCRPFMDMNVFTSSDQINFSSDASASPDLGMGAIFESRWIVAAWGKEFIKSQKPSIEFLELYALVAGIITWSQRLSNCRIIVKCDNQAVVQMINKLTSTCPQCMKLIRLLTLDGILRNRRVFVQYIRSRDNILPDALLRFHMDRFWKFAPRNMQLLPDTIHTDIWPVEKVWFTNKF